jgi:hypothetical protein
MAAVKRVFKVNGKPFFPLGSESVTFGHYNIPEGTQEFVFKAVKQMHGNCITIPISWDEIEPEEGKFDFTAVDSLLENGRKYGIKVIPLWFGTWKNAAMEFVPSWIKTNPKRFKRAYDSAGKDLWTLSAHCKANLEADKKAFSALCAYIKKRDTGEQIIIAIQVENEPGIVGSDRDYSPEGEKAFNGPVPAMFIKAMKKQAQGPLYEMWQKAGAKESGAWPEVFDWAVDAGHIMYTWNIARYIDAVAEAGKSVYDIPMFINNWLHPKWWTLHHQYFAPDYNLIKIYCDLYRWATPHIDLISPDNYQPDSRGYEKMCAIYARKDNPLYIVESDGDQNMFRAMADYNCIGYNFSGIERCVDENGIILPEYKAIADNLQCVSSAIPLLLKYQGTGKVHLVIEEGDMTQWMDDLDGYLGVIIYGQGIPPYSPTDYLHKKKIERHEATKTSSARGFVIQTGKHEFYCIGSNWRIYFRPNMEPDKNRKFLTARDFQLDPKQTHYVSVEQGNFNEKGEFVPVLRRNGARVNHGVWVEADIGVVRVVLTK